MKNTGMNRLVVAAAVFACGLAACGMPTKEELVQAQALVADLTADDVRAMKSGAKKPGEVAAAQVALADEAETEAGKYLLLQGAFRLYSRSADYDAAADVLARMRRDISDLPPEVVVELITGEFRRVAAGKAEKVMVIYRDARRTIRCRKELAAAEKAATAKPGDVAVQRRVAECHAVLGDWAKALEVFAKLGVEAAKFELDPASAKGCDASKAADFWWNYPTKDNEPFQVHAADIYRKGLADGSISGLRKTLAEKRVKQIESVLPTEGGGYAANVSADAAANVSAAPRGGTSANALYCVINLSAGSTADKYPVSYLPAEPKGGWTDEYKTTKLVLRRIEPGKFMMLDKYDVTITKPYYIAEFPVYAQQFELVTGTKPSVVSAEGLASVSWDLARGKSDVHNWPAVKTVDATSFIGLLRLRTDLELDLPTEAQWEFARRSCRWDIVTECQELCLDWWSETDFVKNGAVDPEGPAKSNQQLKVLRMNRGRARVAPDSGSFITKGKKGTKRLWCRTIRLCMSAERDASSDRGVSRGSGAPATSINDAAEQQSAKVVEPPSARPKDMSLTLRSGVVMDFVGCPAGSFQMGKPGMSDPKSDVFEHKVTIMRPFWIGKFPVTVEQWASVMGRMDLTDAQKAMGPKMPVSVDRSDILNLALKLTRMNQNKLPKGYVIRLPSEAEWEYAVRANSTDPDDPYAWIRGGGRKFDGEWDQYRTSTKDILAFLKDKGITFKYNEKQKNRMVKTGKPELPFFGKIFGVVGEHRPNAWGIHDFFHGRDACETVLDTVSSSMPTDFFGKNRSEYFFKEGDSDPLNYAGERRIHAIILNDGPKMHVVPNHPKILFRLVIGPDLLKERGIK